ncbi:MAG TPA: S1C family serine protease [Pirellulaceae bacterium]|nr:S1C family serine protease [Pirellulaceae bacterium]
MHIVLRCPCGANLKADVKLAGRELKCPKCQNKIVVPAAPPETPPTELEVVDPMQLPFAPIYPQPGATPQMMPGQPVQPQYGYPPQAYAQPVRKPQRQVSAKSRTVFWVISGSVIGVVFVTVVSILWITFSSGSNQYKKSQGKFTMANSTPLIGGDPDLDNSISASMAGAPAQNNRFDSGKRELRDAAYTGSDRDLDMADLIERVEPSIVRLKVRTLDHEGVGSGFFVDMEGKIVTNLHVVQGASEVMVSTADGKQTRAVGWISFDAGRDLAIIQVDPTSLNIVPIPIAASLPRRGEEVAAFGAPAGFSFSATKGTISAIRPGSDVRNTMMELSQDDVYTYMGYTPDMNWIQHSVAISGGNSGGPLVNMRGELVGVNTWTYTAGQNLNFASTLEEVSKIFKDRKQEIRDFQGGRTSERRIRSF